MSNTLGWINKSLGDLGDYINGYPFSPGQLGGDGIPVIRIQQLNNPEGFFDFTKAAVPERNHIDTGDLIFSWSGTLKVSRWKHGFAYLNQHLFKVTPKKWVNSEFLRHSIEYALEELTKVSHGSTMKHIQRGELDGHILAVPASMEEQRGIAEVLSALDEQIEATEALIRKKTAVKRALAMTLMTKPHGLVGANWRETSFGALVVSVREKFLPTEQARTVQCVNLEDLPEGEGRISGFTSAADNLSTKTAFKKGDILFGKLRPYLRKFAVTPFDGVCTTEILVLRAVKDVDPDFVFQVVASDAFIEHNVASSYGTKMPRTDWRTAASFPVALPSLAEQRVIGQTLSAADAELEELRAEAAKLRLQKQGLMKDLLTGAVRV